MRPLTDRFLKSSIEPEDCVSAACRCNINFSFEVEEVGATSSVTGVRSTADAVVGFLLGLSWTEMVVPKRECLDDALRATLCLDFASAWRRRWRFSVGCYIARNDNDKYESFQDECIWFCTFARSVLNPAGFIPLNKR